MARLDVYRPKPDQLLLDFQGDTLKHLETRIVAPLIPTASVQQILPRLHPMLEFDGVQLVLATQLLSAVPARVLGTPIGTLTAYEYEILNALDMLLTGV